ECSEAAMKQALDIGADGVIVPAVNSVEQARDVVRWCKFPPMGVRGVGLARANGYGLTFADYMANANNDTLVVIQVEHIDAVNDIEAIADVDGIDCVFIGPYDLSASMDLMGQVTHPDVLAAIARVGDVCNAKGVALGYFGVDVDAVSPYRDAGFGLICAGTDASWLIGNVQDAMQSLKKSS
ncbi:MAG: aldolase/citrate lyase family protein, partial [Pseudomonadota bacterium]